MFHKFSVSIINHCYNYTSHYSLEQRQIRLSISRVANRNVYTVMARITELCCVIGLVGLVLFLFIFLLYDRYGR